MISFCPRCGTEFPLDLATQLARLSLRCSGCRLALTEVPSMLAPADDEDAEIGYELTDWPVSDRGQASAALAAYDIPYRWEAGLVLVVPAAREDEVDRLLDGISRPAESADDGEAEGAGATAGDADEDEEEDGGEEAQAAMANLFVAADRLQHHPFDTAAGTDLRAAAAVVDGSPPPYGIERTAWKAIREMSEAVLAGLDTSAEDDEVAGAARTLREYLRDYV